MRFHHYVSPDGWVIRIKRYRKPTRIGKCYVVYQELLHGKWEAPCFPEISWTELKRHEYLGAVKAYGK